MKYYTQKLRFEGNMVLNRIINYAVDADVNLASYLGIGASEIEGNDVGIVVMVQEFAVDAQ